MSAGLSLFAVGSVSTFLSFAGKNSFSLDLAIEDEVAANDDVVANDVAATIANAATNHDAA